MTLQEFVKSHSEQFNEALRACNYDMSESAAAGFWLRAFVRLVRERAKRENKFAVTELELIGASFIQTAKDLRLEEAEP